MNEELYDKFLKMGEKLGLSTGTIDSIKEDFSMKEEEGTEVTEVTIEKKELDEEDVDEMSEQELKAFAKMKLAKPEPKKKSLQEMAEDRTRGNEF